MKILVKLKNKINNNPNNELKNKDIVKQIIKDIPKFSKIEEFIREQYINNTINVEIVEKKIHKNTQKMTSSIMLLSQFKNKAKYKKYEDEDQQVLDKLNKSYLMAITDNNNNDNLKTKSNEKILENLQLNKIKEAYMLSRNRLKNEKNKKSLYMFTNIVKQIGKMYPKIKDLEKYLITKIDEKLINANKLNEEDKIIYRSEKYKGNSENIEFIETIKNIINDSHIKIKLPQYKQYNHLDNNIKLIYEHLALPKIKDISKEDKRSNTIYVRFIQSIFEIYYNTDIQIKLNELHKNKLKNNKSKYSLKKDDKIIQFSKIINPKQDENIKQELKLLFTHKYIGLNKQNEYSKQLLKFDYNNIEYYISESGQYRFENNGTISLEKDNIFSEIIKINNLFDISEEEQIYIMHEFYKQKNNKYNRYKINQKLNEFKETYKYNKAYNLLENTLKLIGTEDKTIKDIITENKKFSTYVIQNKLKLNNLIYRMDELVN